MEGTKRSSRRARGALEFEAETLEGAFRLGLADVVAAARKRGREASRTFWPVCGDLSALCYGRGRVEDGETTLILANIEAVFVRGDLASPERLGGDRYRHGLGVWTAARRACEAMLAEGEVDGIVFEVVQNGMLRDSLRRRGYREVGSGSNASFDATRDRPPRADGVGGP